MKKLSSTAEKFILHWGEMGVRWGINRTVAQIHALLYISPEPLHAEQIAETLSVARSNVSTSLRELQGWGIIKVVHVLGDRRDHFTALKDVWEMFRIILDERKRREIDPTLAILRECVAEAEQSGEAEEYTRRQLGTTLKMFETTASWYDGLRRLPTSAVIKFVKMGSRIWKRLGLEEKGA